MQKWIIFIIILVIMVLGMIIVLNVDIETEYTPELEVKETELRNTLVCLYFKDKITGELTKETRLIDSKELLKDPYETLIQLLLNGPENDNYERIIPEGTSMIGKMYENGCVTINFSKEFKDSINEEEINNAVESIFKTLSELKEVSSIKIIVDNQEVEGISKVISSQNYQINDIVPNEEEVNNAVNTM